MHRFRHHPLIGTIVEIAVALPDGVDAAEAHRLDDLMVAEMVRLQRVCSAFDPHSELERWKRGEVAEPSPDFCDVMAAARGLQLDTGGAFNTAAGVLTDAWRAAEQTGAVPDDALLAELAASIAEPRFAIDGDRRPVAVDDCSVLQLNAFAKGWIVDRALALGWEAGVASAITVNAGGDLAHRSTAGMPGAMVGIENPLRPYDNEPPLMTIELVDAGLATSGRARRGFLIGGRRYSHVLDPRTGLPVDAVASVSVVAPTAGLADAMATLLGVLDTDAAIAAADRRGLACLRIASDGARTSNTRWDRLAVD